METMNKNALLDLIKQTVGIEVSAMLDARGFKAGTSALVPMAGSPGALAGADAMQMLYQMLSGQTQGYAPVPPGMMTARMVKVLAATKANPQYAAQLYKKQWGEDAAYKALAATDSAAGGFTVPEVMSAGVVELLRPASAVRRMNPMVLPMGAGNLHIPKLAGGAAASYIGENVNVPKTQPSFGEVVAMAKKLGALVPISNDMLRRTDAGAETLIRDDLVSAIAQRSDLAFIRDQGVAGTPRGLYYWAPAANLIPANGTVNLANVTTDLGKLMLALLNANVRMLRAGWLMSPRSYIYLTTVRDGNGNFVFRQEMLAGTLWGFPFAFTTQIPVNLGSGTNESEVYFVDFADVIIAESTTLMIDASSEAAYHDGSQVVASFSLDQTVIRAIIEHDLVLRHQESVAVLTAVLWGA